MSKDPKDPKDPHGPPADDRKVSITVVVNGVPTSVERNANAPLGSVVEKALEQTGNVGQAGDGWELRDEHGVTLDVGRKISEFGFMSGVTLFLSLKAGVGG
jgi:Protein of Unknown function (DUF2604)